ncbi:HamA C-terminal domain-containing protein [Tsuneonella sp. SYSU-LHT278]|uniref:HamA C-terminal domain-containing protein n=1 Tax=Tsuneonella sediminis TaxID=3416089 RepID=UPI003F7ACEB2
MVGVMLSPYSSKPKRLLTQLAIDETSVPASASYCAGFELQAWRCDSFADHLIEWIADYALKEDELRVDHGNMYIRLREAAVRVYRSENYKQRGEVGEIVLHAICRDFFNTVPFAPRVFYLTSSNDVVKSFDLVHVRDLPDGGFELWLGEAKFYRSAIEGIKAAIDSVTEHIDQGFLKNEKLLLGPQVSKSLAHYREIRDLLSVQTSLDDLFKNAVFPICITCDSKATQSHETFCKSYTEAVGAELSELVSRLRESGLTEKIRIMLIYVPLGSKGTLADAFDSRLKGLCP